MNDKLDEVERHFERLTAELSSPAVLADSAKLLKLTRERAGLEKLVETYRTYTKVAAEVASTKELAISGDADFKAMAKEELPALEATKAELVDSSGGNQGGLKDATLTLAGEHVYSVMKYESGVHRVQRVPATETQGRIHTSTITVAVMPEAEEADVQVKDADVDMQVMRSTGAGGQSVNTTDSAVRLTHKPTGIVVKCQQEKSQLKNRAMAMKMLRTRLYEMELERLKNERDGLRKGQVGSGDRSEKVRTYNFPQDRLTDHRIGYTRHNLPAAMAGDIDDLFAALRTHFQAEALKSAGGSS